MRAFRGKWCTTLLRLAFSWTCEDCGTDHYARPVPATPEMLEEVRGYHARDLDQDAQVYQIAPESVTCPDCKVTFATAEA